MGAFVMINCLAMNCLGAVTFVSLPQYLSAIMHLGQGIILVYKCEGENYKRGCCGREGFCSFFLKDWCLGPRLFVYGSVGRQVEGEWKILGKQKKKHLNNSLGK